MLGINQPCYISLPNPQNRRVLIPGKVVAAGGDGSCQIAFEEPLEFVAGGDATLYAHWRNKFHQQGAKIRGVETQEAKLVVSFDRVGEPINCETRGCYRVSVVSQNIHMTVGTQGNGLLADISAEGLSVIVAQPLTIGTTVDVQFAAESIRVSGKLRVQSEKKLANGTFRYGLYAFEKRSALREALGHLSGVMQRLQLKRRSAAA